MVDSGLYIGLQGFLGLDSKSITCDKLKTEEDVQTYNKDRGFWEISWFASKAKIEDVSPYCTNIECTINGTKGLVKDGKCSPEAYINKQQSAQIHIQPQPQSEQQAQQQSRQQSQQQPQQQSQQQPQQQSQQQPQHQSQQQPQQLNCVLNETYENNGVCEAVRQCTSTEYETQPATLTSNRICNTIRSCTQNEYETQPPTLTSNRICEPLTQCNLTTHYVSVQPTSTTDRECLPLNNCRDVVWAASQFSGDTDDQALEYEQSPPIFNIETGILIFFSLNNDLVSKR